MDLQIPEELRMVQETARDFADEYLAPRAAAIDREGRFPLEEFQACAKLGLTGMLVPDELGGSYLGHLGMTLVMEEINRACASTGTTLSVHVSLATNVINQSGSDEVRARFLPNLARGELLGAYSLSEPNAGSDAASIQTLARRDGDHYILDGAKAWVTNGGHADLTIVYATLDRSLRTRGITAFIVPRDAPGLSVGKFEKKLGIRGSSTTTIFLDECRIPVANRLGEEGEGFKVAMKGLDGGRIGIASQALGIGRACLEAATKYAKERTQFGRPIGDFQGIQWKLANMATELDAARMLVHRAAWLKDRKRPHVTEASMAKLYASEVANRCAREAVQILGGVGYTKEFPVERYYRDAKITEIYEGTSEIQRLVISRGLLRG